MTLPMSRKVQSGDPLIIPASTFNGFVDASEAHRSRTAVRTLSSAGSGLQPGEVWIRFNSPIGVSKYNVLSIFTPVVTPDDNLEEFQERVVFNARTPFSPRDDTTLVILQEAAEVGPLILNTTVPGFFRAKIQGITPCQVRVTDEDHGFAKIETTNGAARRNRLESSAAATPYRILWKPEAPSLGIVWCMIQIGAGGGGGRGAVFAVSLLRVSGTSGTASVPASWRYNISAIGGDVLETSVGPTESPHKWKRALGKIQQATSGLAYRDEDDALVLTWINEIYEHGTCDS